MLDNFGREFHYLRLSVTDACNFKCVYCLPDGYQKTSAESSLTVIEIRRLVKAFAELGFWKFRVTGGEPTLRPDIISIIQVIHATPGTDRVVLSTNGFRLKTLARNLKQAGVYGVNVSVDSLDRDIFAQRAGRDCLHLVLAGIEEALAFEIQVKVNVVLMRERAEHTLSDFLKWIRVRPVSVRFIELMQTQDNDQTFRSQFLSCSLLQADLLKQGWKRCVRNQGDGPATVFAHPDYLGTVGLIAPYSPDFCVTCNRLRVTSRGELSLCLFGNAKYDLRTFLQSDDQCTELQCTLRSLIIEKQASHYLQRGDYGQTDNFASIGG